MKLKLVIIIKSAFRRLKKIKFILLRDYIQMASIYFLVILCLINFPITKL